MSYALADNGAYFRAVADASEVQTGEHWVEETPVLVLPSPTHTDLRRAAYLIEADPLFMKAQRGEGTTQQWLDKITEIKARYPAA